MLRSHGNMHLVDRILYAREDIVHDRNGYWFTAEFENTIFGPYESERDAIVAQMQYDQDTE